MTNTSFFARGRIGSLRTVAAAILFGLGTGLALAQGDSGGLYSYRTMQQVQSHNYTTHYDQNGDEQFPGR